MFVPKLAITDIPLNASTFTVADITGASPTDTTGYGLAAYLPQNNTIWTKQTEIQYLGTDPVDVPFDPTSDNVEVSAILAYQLKDGVYLVTQYWSKAAEATFLGTEASEIITRTGGSPWTGDLGLLENVYGIGADATDLESIAVLSNLTSTTASLSQAYGGNLSDAFIFYRIQQYMLITNGGVAQLHADIGDMIPLNLASGSCSAEQTDAMFRRVLLKSSAVINFNCSNYAKAHNAAILLAELSNGNKSTTCAGCV